MSAAMEELLCCSGATIGAAAGMVSYYVFPHVYWIFRSYLLTRWSTIVCDSSSEQSLKDCSLDFIGTFIFNPLQVEQSLCSPFTLESIVSIDKTLQSQR
jgi:hypothetical protein